MPTICTVETEDGARVEVAVRPGQHLLAALRAHGVAEVPVGCHGGGCGVCRIRVLEGDYRCRPMSRRHVSEAEQANGYALACCVLSEGDVVIRTAPRS